MPEERDVGTVPNYASRGYSRGEVPVPVRPVAVAVAVAVPVPLQYHTGPCTCVRVQ